VEPPQIKRGAFGRRRKEQGVARPPGWRLWRALGAIIPWMALAYVGDDGDGRFSADVECDEDCLFSHVDGPTGVGPEEAIAWARRHAERVTVRVGVDFYTAGSEAVRDLPSWPGHGNNRELPSEPAHLSDWQVEGRTGWFRDDASDVARANARRLTATPARDVAHGVTKTGFRVTFAIRAGSIVRARELASELLRAAWSAARIDAVPGDDYDASSVTVTPSPGATQSPPGTL
jgi:hypothetical protein